MLQLLAIVVLVLFLGILVLDLFSKKKTEINGAHVVVG